ncbi:unnamed protein product [Anisakis simplex]|uniref:Receptor expression-enhancing protein n=1 Tax=Anisakis simplex TaxID=6269 RepID=A0A0M3K967_ANISI|nr:unnamed protein product [Anisakis simplex]
MFSWLSCIAKKPSQTTINSFNDIHPAVLDLLYNQLTGQLAKYVKDLGDKGGVKREEFFYGLTAFVCFYLVFGSEAGLMCNLLGFVYPAFATLQMSEFGQAKDQAVAWLIYWTVFRAFPLTDFYADTIRYSFPIYWLCKAIFLVYLFLPQTGGAQKFYEKLVAPTFGRIESAIVNYDSKKKE